MRRSLCCTHARRQEQLRQEAEQQLRTEQEAKAAKAAERSVLRQRFSEANKTDAVLLQGSISVQGGASIVRPCRA